MFAKAFLPLGFALFLASPSCMAQQSPQLNKNVDDKPVVALNAQKGCRNISAEIRSGAPLTREIVIAEMVRARAEGEMDFYISTTPPAIYRPLCELPPQIPAPQLAPKAKD